MQLATRVALVWVSLAGLAAHVASAHALGTVEARIADGIAVGGGPDTTVINPTPVHVGVLADHAVEAEPWTSIFGESFLEIRRRAGVGFAAGARVRPLPHGTLRLTAGAEAIVAPYTLAGVRVGAGACPSRRGPLRFCLDLEGRAFFAGDDLPADTVAGAVTLAMSVAIDAW